jgi:Flp pilus assembly protein TadG
VCARQPRPPRRATTRRGAPGAGGQSLVELALLLPLLALLLLGATDLARVFVAHVRLTDAAMAGAVYAGHYPADTSTITARAYAAANGQLGALGTDFTIDASTGVRCYRGQTTALIASTPAGDCAAKNADGTLVARPGDTVEVTATYAFKPITGQVIRLLGADYRIRARVRMVIQ